MIHRYTMDEMIFIFLFWGMIGWLVEVIDMRIEAGEFQNRGFLHMPICPLYGLGMLVMCTLFKNEKSAYGLLFIFGIIVGSVVEYLVGWVLEELFHTRWWDYSHMRYQIKGRVCLRNTVLFGFGAIFTIGFMQPVVDMIIYRIPTPIGTKIVCLVVIVLAIDTAISIHRALQYRNDCENGNVFVVFKSHK